MRNGVVIVRAREWPTSPPGSWVSLSADEFTEETPVFSRTPPRTFTGVPPSQRRPAIDDDIQHKYLSTLTRIQNSRQLSERSVQDCSECIALLASPQELKFTWPHVSLSELAVSDIDTVKSNIGQV